MDVREQHESGAPSPEKMRHLSFQQTCRNDTGLGLFADLSTLTKPMEAHHHDFWEIAFAMKGRGQHEDALACFPMLSGDVWIIQPGAWHAFPVVKEPVSIFNLLCTPAFLNGYTSCVQELSHLKALHPSQNAVIQHLRLSTQRLEQISTLLVLLATELRSPQSSGTTTFCSGLFLQILGLLERSASETPAPSAEHEHLRADTGLLNAVQYIEEHYADVLTLDEIAQQSGYTPTHLARKFRQQLGVPPIDYLIQVRLHHACALLQASELSITRIAHAVGFTDSRYFATRFRAVMGRTPSAFRAQAQNTH